MQLFTTTYVGMKQLAYLTGKKDWQCCKVFDVDLLGGYVFKNHAVVLGIHKQSVDLYEVDESFFCTPDDTVRL